MTDPKRVRAAGMKSVPWRSARFIAAAHELDELPPDTGAEIACAGRSNSGKSSALNAITGIGGLAKVSKTPGRTQQLVVFAFDDTRRLVDMPGYGYAKVSLSLRAHWGAMLSDYFETRTCLRGLLITMDIRHPMTEIDHDMLGFGTSVQLPCHVLLTKADKLSRSQTLVTLRRVQKLLGEMSPDYSAQLFSAPDKLGVDEARQVMAAWLAEDA